MTNNIDADLHIESAIRKLMPYGISHYVNGAMLELQKGKSLRQVRIHMDTVKRDELNQAITYLRG